MKGSEGLYEAQRRILAGLTEAQRRWERETGSRLVILPTAPHFAYIRDRTGERAA